jgi:hypothetical protein
LGEVFMNPIDYTTDFTKDLIRTFPPRNIDQSSVPMEGPMRFAGRGIPKHEVHNYPTKEWGPINPNRDAPLRPPLAAPIIPHSRPEKDWRPDLAGTVDYSQWTEDNPVNIHYGRNEDTYGKPYPIYGWEGGIPDISMLNYGIDVPGGQGIGNAAGDPSVFGSPYPGYLNDNRDAMSPHYPDEYTTEGIRPEVVYPPSSTTVSSTDTRSDWQKWKDSFRENWKTK